MAVVLVVKKQVLSRSCSPSRCSSLARAHALSLSLSLCVHMSRSQALSLSLSLLSLSLSSISHSLPPFLILFFSLSLSISLVLSLSLITYQQLHGRTHARTRWRQRSSWSTSCQSGSSRPPTTRQPRSPLNVELPRTRSPVNVVVAFRAPKPNECVEVNIMSA